MRPQHVHPAYPPGRGALLAAALFAFLAGFIAPIIVLELGIPLILLVYRLRNLYVLHTLLRYFNLNVGDPIVLLDYLIESLRLLQTIELLEHLKVKFDL